MTNWDTTERLAAAITMADGTSFAGDLHLQRRAPHHDGPETALELLNREDLFFALTHADGAVTFVSKAQVMSVSCAQSPVADPTRASVAKVIALEVVSADGSSFRGWATAELPPTRGRTLDYLNGPGRFFGVWTEPMVRYLNRAHVRVVRPIE